MFLRTILSVPAFIANAILELAVHMVASFLAMVLNHPAVMNAGASTIVAGMKQLCLEEDLDVHAQALSETLTKHMERDALRAGKDFPKLWSQFIKGVMAGDDKEEEADKKEEKKDHRIKHINITNGELGVPTIKTHHSAGERSVETRATSPRSDTYPNEHRKSLGDFFKGVLTSGKHMNLDDEELTHHDDSIVDFEAKMTEKPSDEQVLDDALIREDQEELHTEEQQREKGLGIFFFKGVLKNNNNNSSGESTKEETAEENKEHRIISTFEEDSTRKEEKISNGAGASLLKEDGQHREEHPNGLEQFFKGVMGASSKNIVIADRQLHHVQDHDTQPRLESTNGEESSSLTIGDDSVSELSGSSTHQETDEHHDHKGLGQFFKVVMGKNSKDKTMIDGEVRITKRGAIEVQ